PQWRVWGENPRDLGLSRSETSFPPPLTPPRGLDRDSCQKGWRLLYILTAYYKCSEVLKPYLLWHLQETCRSPGAQFQGIAKACEQNLRKTFQFGGRREFPSSMELKAMVAGRSAKRQLFLLPGGIERHLKIKTCSVALDVIEEMCYEMGLHRPEVFDEYVIFAVTNGGEAWGQAGGGPPHFLL
uniref:MyTH4 domain-containing protein n=1 Tax=Terrapene triunguis TaxID=2587831 RepID=A0A674JM82_9SAUR